MPFSGGSFGLYIAVMVLTLIIGGGAQAYVSSQLKGKSRIQSSWGVTGVDMARRMAHDKGIGAIPVYQGGSNQDHFDPRNNSVTLGTETFGQTSLTAVATAVHEVGHACQYAEGYWFMSVRSAFAPIASLASNGWIIVFFMGIFFGAASALGAFFIKLGIVMFAAVLLFHLITLPVEFDASRRGLAYLRDCGMSQGELAACSQVLRACALTYVAAALTALIQFLYMLLSVRDN